MLIAKALRFMLLKKFQSFFMTSHANIDMYASDVLFAF